MPEAQPYRSQLSTTTIDVKPTMRQMLSILSWSTCFSGSIIGKPLEIYPNVCRAILILTLAAVTPAVAQGRRINRRLAQKEHQPLERDP